MSKRGDCGEVRETKRIKVEKGITNETKKGTENFVPNPCYAAPNPVYSVPPPPRSNSNFVGCRGLPSWMLNEDSRSTTKEVKMELPIINSGHWEVRYVPKKGLPRPNKEGFNTRAFRYDKDKDAYVMAYVDPENPHNLIDPRSYFD